MSNIFPLVLLTFPIFATSKKQNQYNYEKQKWKFNLFYRMYSSIIISECLHLLFTENGEYKYYKKSNLM